MGIRVNDYQSIRANLDESNPSKGGSGVPDKNVERKIIKLRSDYPFLSELLKEGKIKIGDFVILKEPWGSCLMGRVVGMGQNSVILEDIDNPSCWQPIFAEAYWVLDINPIIKKDSSKE